MLLQLCNHRALPANLCGHYYRRAGHAVSITAAIAKAAASGCLVGEIQCVVYVHWITGPRTASQPASAAHLAHVTSGVPFGLNGQKPLVVQLQGSRLATR